MRLPTPAFSTFVATAALAVALATTSPANAAAAGSADADGRQKEAVATALDHLRSQAGSLGLSASDLADVVASDVYTSRHTGTTHVYLRQRFGGIEVHNAVFTVNISSDGRVAAAGNRFAPDLRESIRATAPVLSATAAVELAAAEIGLGPTRELSALETALGPDRSALLSDGGVSLEPIPVRLVYQPLASGELRLAWNLEIQELDQRHHWSARVDAVDGRLLDLDDFVDEETYEVYPVPVESPEHTAPLPPADARSTEIDPYLDGIGSPFGWDDTDGFAGAEFTITRGNTAHAYADTDNNGTPDGAPNDEPDGGAGLDFTGVVVPIDLTMDPSTFPQASIANLFYWNNAIHDITYQYGFDEPAGNFQVNNYGNGGLGGDDVRAEAQDGGGNCNANFATPPDGFRPRMQMYNCNIASPRRDGDLDNFVIVHEYAHGISNRLTGGPGTTSCLNNTEQMGEGWSDWLGLVLTMESGDLGTDARGAGTYLFGQPASGAGIRARPYSTDFAVNEFTYDNIKTASVPHGVGHVWATMIWDMTWALVDEHGFNPDFYDDWTTGGNNLATQLVMDGMKLQPCNPGFVDGRDAILLADDLLTGGANACTIWQSFADRGLGVSADQGSAFSRADGTEGYDVPVQCNCDNIRDLAATIRATAPGEFVFSSYRIIMGYIADAAARNCDLADYRDVVTLLNRIVERTDGAAPPSDWMVCGGAGCPRDAIHDEAEALRDGFATLLP